MGDTPPSQRRPISPAWFYGAALLTVAWLDFIALFWTGSPLYQIGGWALVILLLIRLGHAILRAVTYHDAPIYDEQAEIAKAKETAQRRDRLNRVLHQPLEPIVSSDFTSKPRETCYWAEPRVINQDGIFGSLYVTNERIVFISPSLTHSFALDAIVGIEPFTEGVRIDLYNATPLAFTCGDNAISVVIQRLKLGYITQVPNDAFPDPQNPSH